MDQSDLSQVATTADAVSATEIHNPDPNHQVVEMKFGFRTKKDETSGVETKRPAVEVKLPVLSFEGLVSVLKNAGTEAGKKQYELLQQAVQGVYEANIKDFLADNENITSENFPILSSLGKLWLTNLNLSVVVVALLRKSGKISSSLTLV
jgi:hypothetical protein